MTTSTSPIVIRCLGAFGVSIGSGAAPVLPTDKARALLVYLALESRPGRPHRREALAGMFWPEYTEAKALTNLRLTLHRLRQALEHAAPGASAALVLTRQTAQLKHTALEVDTVRFQVILAESAAHSHQDVLRCERCLTNLSEAAKLYNGELLAGFGLADAPAFEEWLLLHREVLHQQALMALHVLATAYEQRGDDYQAHLYASRQLTLEPPRESAHRQIIRLLARRGQFAEAIAQYHLCCRLLREELSAEPDSETLALYEQIRSGEITKQANQTPPAPHSPDRSGLSPDKPQWGEAPEVVQLYGRERELAQLEHRLIQDRCQLIVVVGMGGVGKTTLAATAVKAASPQFDVVIWHSLLNAPPLDELLRDLLPALSLVRLVDLPTRLDAQLALLLDFLREQRCLLVLDNLESILEANEPGQMRSGYAAYTQLIQVVAERRHQSCLLLTSREQPQGMERWENNPSLVYTLPLVGIGAAAGQAMLTARGLAGAAVEATELVARYSGNPLALNLVAQTVKDLFGGDIAAFLSIEAPIFDDIRAVLDQQFTRLSPLEQQILIWLAIEREPVSVHVLRDNLVAPGSSRAVLEALRRLRQRSLVEQNVHGCGLQNVVTEYLTGVLVDQVCSEIADDFGLSKQPAEVYHPQSTINSQSLRFSASALNRYTLIKATAKEYVRASQERLILQPLAQQLVARMSSTRLVEQLKRIIANLREEHHFMPGYAAGNILNLLLHLHIDVRGYDFSRLTIWQAYLQGARLPDVNFREADLAHSVFTHVFGEIMAICFDTEGQLLVAGLAEGVLCVWRAADGQLLREYQSFDAGAQHAVFSADGRLLVSSNTDHKVRIWDVVSGRLLHTLVGHAATPWSLMLSMDCTLLATGGVDGVVHVWDVPTGQLRHTFDGHTRAVVGLIFTRDSQVLASSDVDGCITVWWLDQPETFRSLQGHNEEVHGLAFDATGTILASSSFDSTIRLWDIRSGQVIQVLEAHTQMIRTLAISADGQTLASGGPDSFVCLWDVRSGRALGTLLGSTYATTLLAFSADNQLLATVGADHTVFLWHVATGQRLDTLYSYNNHIYSVDFSSDGQMLASGGSDCNIYLWERASGRLVRTLQGHTRAVYSVAFNPDGELVASAGREASIYLWSIQSGQVIGRLTGHTNDIESVQFSPDGHWLISASRDRTLRVWDIRTRQVLYKLHGHTDQVRSCALSSDGSLLASGGHDRTVRIWDLRVAGGQLLHTLHGHTNSVKSVCFSPDGRFVASSAHDQTVRVWDVQQGDALYTLQTQTLFSVAFHTSGELLASGGASHTLELWDIAPRDQRIPSERKLSSVLRGHTDLVECVRFSRDGRWLASSSADETIRLWDVATGVCLHTLRADGPYAGMNITGVTGMSVAQKAALKALGAVEVDRHNRGYGSY